MANYYSRQLEVLNLKSDYPISVLFRDGEGNKTNQMSLNPESVEVFTAWLNDNFLNSKQTALETIKELLKELTANKQSSKISGLEIDSSTYIVQVFNDYCVVEQCGVQIDLNLNNLSRTLLAKIILKLGEKIN